MSREAEIKLLGEARPVHISSLPAHLRRSDPPTAETYVIASHPSAAKVAERIMGFIDTRGWFKHSEITGWSWPGIDVLMERMHAHKILVRKATANGGGHYWLATSQTRAWCLCALSLASLNKQPKPL